MTAINPEAPEGAAAPAIDRPQVVEAERKATNITWHEGAVTREERASLLGHEVIKSSERLTIILSTYQRIVLTS